MRASNFPPDNTYFTCFFISFSYCFFRYTVYISDTFTEIKISVFFRVYSINTD